MTKKTLDTRITELTRVGKTLDKRLARLGIETCEDLLYHFPFRYEDYSRIVPIAELVEGEEVTVRGKVDIIANKRSRRKRMMITEAVISDDSGQMRIAWFRQPYITKKLKAGDTVYLSGKVKQDMFGTTLQSPAFEKEQKETIHTAKIVPIYRLTSGLSQKQMRFLINQVIELADSVEEWIPDEVRDRADVMPLSEAIRALHDPESSDELEHARRRMAFDEVFILQMRAEMLRRSLSASFAPQMTFHDRQIKAFVNALPFDLTDAQRQSAWDILKDLQQQRPMNRLLEGDVGAGKTIVAALVSYNAVLDGYQVAIMAPTEILAQQHYASFCELFADKDIHVGLVTRTSRESNREESVSKKQALYYISSGAFQIVIGTHALLSEKITFHDLGLVIVDEQHRFGVEQRKRIKEQSGNDETTPHFLSMTATPIPRSYALALYGDLDLSIINQLPKGRKPVKTRFVEPRLRQKAYDFIKKQVSQGRQVFVICPLIEEDGKTGGEKKSVMSEYEKLRTEIFPDLKIGYLHGKMKSTEKDHAMGEFASGDIDILVSTSVVEVGVNIPNASVMMIEGAERFGLAQLHQFRGRVGRSSHQSYCMLFTDSESTNVKERLSFFESTTDGFKVAEYDLEMRGPGDVYGRAQSGEMHLRFASLRDKQLIALANAVAKDIDITEYPSLVDTLRRWEEQVHLE